MIWNHDYILSILGCEIIYGHGSAYTPISTVSCLRSLTYFTIQKIGFGRACSQCKMLWCHWSIFRLISTFYYGSHLMHSTHPTSPALPCIYDPWNAFPPSIFIISNCGHRFTPSFTSFPPPLILGAKFHLTNSFSTSAIQGMPSQHLFDRVISPHISQNQKFWIWC